MKKVFSLYKLALFLDKFKIAHQGLFVSLGAVLLCLQNLVNNPDVVALINSIFPEANGMVSTVVKGLPMLIAILISPRTQKRIEAGPNGI